MIRRHLKPLLMSVFISHRFIRKALNKNGIHVRLNKNTAAHLMFAKDHLDAPWQYWSDFLWTYEEKKELSGKRTQHYVLRKQNSTYQD